MNSCFAQLDDNDVVENVIVIPASEAHRGEDFITSDLGLPGRWIETDMRSHFGVRLDTDMATPTDEPAFRHTYAGIGYRYLPDLDIFVPPPPFPSWVFDPVTLQWTPPSPYPDEGLWVWDEDTLAWVES